MEETEFTSRILNFIFGEGHGISKWGKLGKEYLHMGPLNLRVM